MEKNNSTIQQLHEQQLEILKYVADFCDINTIPYSLYCGTLLGAVRHQGFIPWDDDVDICMLRNDYERFIRLWKDDNGLILQNKENTPSFTQCFTKIRKENTLFLQENEVDDDINHGIFIDIFPLDRIPSNGIRLIKYIWDLANYLVFTRDFVPPKSNGIVSMVVKLLLLLPTSIKDFLRRYYYKCICKYNDRLDLGLISANTLGGIKHIMPSDLPNNYVKMKFEGLDFNCYENFDGLLKAWYNNYMELPPIEERVWKHKPIKIVFDNQGEYNE